MPKYKVPIYFYLTADDLPAARDRVNKMMEQLPDYADDVFLEIGWGKETKNPYEVQCLECRQPIVLDCKSDRSSKIWCCYCDHGPICMDCGSRGNFTNEPYCPSCRRQGKYEYVKPAQRRAMAQVEAEKIARKYPPGLPPSITDADPVVKQNAIDLAAWLDAASMLFPE